MANRASGQSYGGKLRDTRKPRNDLHLRYTAMQDNISRISLRNIFISLAIVAGLVVVVSLYAEPVLRISVMPDEPRFVVNRKMRLLTAYLEHKVGMKVEFRPMRSGDALVESLLFKELDLVWIDGAHLEKARSLSDGGVMPIVGRAEDQRDSMVSVAAPADRRYSWAARSGIDPELKQKLTDIFLTMHTGGGKGMEILGYQHTSRFVPVRIDDGRVDGVGFDGAVTERTFPGRSFSR